MGSHRAERRSAGSRTPRPSSEGRTYVGRRVAGRSAVTTGTPSDPGSHVEAAASSVSPVSTAVAREVARYEKRAERTAKTPTAPKVTGRARREPVVAVGATTDVLTAAESTAEMPLPTAPRAAGGKRKAVKHVGTRGPLLPGLPSPPVLVGVAALAISVGGAVTSAATDHELAAASTKMQAASALGGSSGAGAVGQVDRGQVVSRDSQRDALDDASESELEAEAEQQAEQRNARLGQLAQLAEQQADKIALNRWVLPLDSYRLTATFGEYGLWSSYHTGLDFAAPSGTPIKAMANGTITEVGYDGAYGNKTVLTLDDGTELWFCHQTSMDVEDGQTVRAGEVIGYVGSTGNVTGPHLHLEVRPGGGDPVDPQAALVVNGVTP